LDSQNTLLTGDIGSGKSTLVDAVTTLLVPAHRIAYNKAAGAENRERDLRSYVMGYYKSERSDLGHAAKSVALRDHNTFSVILGVFRNQGYLQEVTLAQVFWTGASNGQPDRFYLIADRPLSITEDFSDFGTDISRLKKRLKKADQTEVFDTFPKYGAGFRRRFGIETEQALALFLQTVSMKSVGNLTDFVREHMLEAFDVTPRIQALMHHFDDLSRAHEAVLKARQQIEKLTPLVQDLTTHSKQREHRQHLRSCREFLTPYFAFQKLALFQKRLDNLIEENNRLDRKITALEADRQEKFGQRDDLRQAIADNGGDRLERLRTQIRRQSAEKDKRKAQAGRYDQIARKLSLAPARDADAFDDNLSGIRELRTALGQQEADQQNLRTDNEVAFRKLKSEHQALDRELASLAGRKSNIHDRQIRIRDELCTRLDLVAKDLPFAGELIQVREGQKAWEGTAERLLHNFALSLLVREDLYPRVAAWVDATHLRGRLVYYLVRQGQRQHQTPHHPDSLARKLAVKSDSPFCLWVEQEIAGRFDYACCTTMDQFRREPRAVTEAGQIKSGGVRHEKDDRHDIRDRSNYVLGWTNAAKIQTLKRRCQDLETQMQTAAVKISDLDKAQADLREKQADLIRLEEYRSFSDLDWQSVAREIQGLKEEKTRLERDSDILNTLNAQVTALEEKIRALEQALRNAWDQRSRVQEKQGQAEAGMSASQNDFAPAQAMDQEERDSLFKEIEVLGQAVFDGHVLTIESCGSREQELRHSLQRNLDNLGDRIRSVEDRIGKAMYAYQKDYPLETKELDDHIASGPEYEAMLDRLLTDNLPRFEKDFKEQLNVNTIREVANFQSQLHRERETIRERIERINRSLSDIEYNPGRYIRLEAQLNPDADIRDFSQQLRACTEGALTGSDDAHYSEGKFLQVKTLIQRFRGREGFSDLDRRWTKKVTDVRNWFVFAASERWRADHTEHEHYTDSGGKSGGQKEKLAYTVLAASLAYQFGLEWGAVRSRTFRFVAIDEAFGRGSDASTRYSLELFKKLNLQLLIVTPLQKIHIIEPYVSSVGLVYSRDGRESQLRNMSIQAFRDARKKKASSQ